MNIGKLDVFWNREVTLKGAFVLKTPRRVEHGKFAAAEANQYKRIIEGDCAIGVGRNSPVLKQDRLFTLKIEYPNEAFGNRAIKLKC